MGGVKIVSGLGFNIVPVEKLEPIMYVNSFLVVSQGMLFSYLGDIFG